MYHNVSLDMRRTRKYKQKSNFTRNENQVNPTCYPTSQTPFQEAEQKKANLIQPEPPPITTHQNQTSPVQKNR